MQFFDEVVDYDFQSALSQYASGRETGISKNLEHLQMCRIAWCFSHTSRKKEGACHLGIPRVSGSSVVNKGSI